MMRIPRMEMLPISESIPDESETATDRIVPIKSGAVTQDPYEYPHNILL